jgi:Holliday junction DNA helicase RuvA
VVEVGGVGLAVHCTPGTLARLRVGEQARLATSLVVREDSLTLYGFADEDERSLFELLQTASGVGPRLAQAVLAVHLPNEVRRAVATEDLTALTRVPGIGRKGAERLVLELRDRIGPVEPAGGIATGPPGAGGDAPWRAQVMQGLTSLGWRPAEAADAVAALAPEPAADGEPDVPSLLKSAIRLLGRR